MENIKEFYCDGVKVVQRSDRKWGVTRRDGTVIVPFGEYDWIDKYDDCSGLARVKIGKESCKMKDNDNKWGIIDMDGDEVLPVEYDEVWNFAGKDRETTRLYKDGRQYTFNLDRRRITWREPLEEDRDEDYDRYDDDDNYCDDWYENGMGCYEKYGGYMGYDDFTIDSVFEGDPDAVFEM